MRIQTAPGRWEDHGPASARIDRPRGYSLAHNIYPSSADDAVLAALRRPCVRGHEGGLYAANNGHLVLCRYCRREDEKRRRDRAKAA